MSARPLDIPPEVKLRFATVEDAGRLAKLAELDSARTPSGRVLIAEVDGVLRAALPLDGGAPIASPFRRSADLVALLRMRAEQMSDRSGRRRGPLATSLSALERRFAHVRPPKPLAPL